MVAPKAGQARAASAAMFMDPGEFVSGGLASDFDGVVIEAVTEVWNYDNGNGPKLDEQGNIILAPFVRLVIQRHDGEESVISHYKAGELEQFMPSVDGENPAEQNPETGLCDGEYFVKTGTKTAMGKDTNWGQLLSNLKDAGFEAKGGQWQASVTKMLLGLDGHWDRVAAKKRSGMVVREEDANKKTNDILCCTAVKAVGTGVAVKPAAAKTAPAAAKPAAAKAAPAAAAAATTPAAAGGSDDELAGIVQSVLKTDGTAVKKGSLPAAVMRSKLAPAVKAASSKKVVDNDWLAAGSDAGLWVFDAESGEVYGIAAEAE